MIRASFAIAIIISCWPTKQSLMWHSHRHFAAPVVRVVKQIFAFVDSSSNSWWKTKRKDRVSQKGDNETHTWSLIEREREHPNLVAALRHCRLSRDVTTAQKSTKNGSGQNLETWGKGNRNRNQWLSQIERKKEEAPSLNCKQRTLRQERLSTVSVSAARNRLVTQTVKWRRWQCKTVFLYKHWWCSLPWSTIKRLELHLPATLLVVLNQWKSTVFGGSVEREEEREYSLTRAKKPEKSFYAIAIKRSSQEDRRAIVLTLVLYYSLSPLDVAWTAPIMGTIW